MRRTIHILMLTAILGSLVGCTGAPGTNPWDAWTPEDRLAIAMESFNGTVKALTTLRQNSVFTVEEGENITFLVLIGKNTLEAWRHAIEEDKPTSQIIADYNEIVSQLMAVRVAAEGETNNGN